MLKKYFLLFIFCFVVYLGHSIYTKQGLYGDGNGYYSYTNTLYFQKNLNFEPIYEHLGNFQGRNGIFSRVFWTKEANPYIVGPGLVWMPSMVFISVISSIFNLQAGRFDLIYEVGPGITGILLMLFGLYFLERYLHNFFSKRVAFWTMLTVFFTSNVLYYSSLEPALSHQPAFFLVCFLLFWTYKFKNSRTNLIILGILSGFFATIRAADVVLLLAIYYQAKLKIKDFWYIVPSALIGFMPQLLVQYSIFNTIFTHPYLTGEVGVFRFNLFHTLEYLFSPMRGLFLWSPVFLIGIWGLIKKKSLVFLFSIIILWLVTSSWSAYLSAGFGQRYSFAAIPFLTLGIAYIFNKFTVKKILSIFIVFFIWNTTLLANFYIHKDRLIQAAKLEIGEFMSLQLKTPFEVLKYIQHIK